MWPKILNKAYEVHEKHWHENHYTRLRGQMIEESAELIKALSKIDRLLMGEYSIIKCPLTNNLLEEIADVYI